MVFGRKPVSIKRLEKEVSKQKKILSNQQKRARLKSELRSLRIKTSPGGRLLSSIPIPKNGKSAKGALDRVGSFSRNMNKRLDDAFSGL